MCCAQNTVAPGQDGVILDTPRPESITQGLSEPATSTSTASVPCIPEALTSKTWYKTLDVSLYETIWAEQGLVGPAVHHAQVNVLVLVEQQWNIASHGALHLSQENRSDQSPSRIQVMGNT